MTPTLSIIIPTHKRSETLQRCLDYIEAQTVREQLEVIVVSDGKDAATDALFAGHTWKIPLTYFAIPKSQQGVARNRGVEKAQSEYCLFIGDDSFLEPDACEKHLATYKNFESRILNNTHSQDSTFNIQNSTIAVLGFITWDSRLEITPVMRWLESSGWQFGYPTLAPYAHTEVPRALQHRFTYTSHISLPTALARQLPFREDVTLYGWEDIEWGMRLRDAGVPLVYEPDAQALHHHHMTLEQSLARMETLGRSALVMEQSVPGFDRVPKGRKLFAYRIAAMLPTMAGRHRRAFLRGIRRGTIAS